MSIPIINDFKQPQLNKTEKAIAMLEAQNQQMQSWAMGLQRQIAGLLLHLKVSPNEHVINTRKQDEINTFLEDTQKAENLMIAADQREAEERAQKATGEKEINPIVKLNENADTQAKESI